MEPRGLADQEARTNAEGGLERVDQLRAGEHPDQRHNGMMLAPMVDADEVDQGSDVPERASLGDVAASDRELAVATELIESLAAGAEGEAEQPATVDGEAAVKRVRQSA